MELFNRILKLRPKVKPSEFRLQDDGKGAYISKWTSSETKPTDAEIASVDDSKPTWIVAEEEIQRLEVKLPIGPFSGGRICEVDGKRKIVGPAGA